MYYVVYVDESGHGYRAIIDKTGVPNKYGDWKLFRTRKQAQQWIDRKSYPMMSYHYEIREVQQ